MGSQETIASSSERIVPAVLQDRSRASKLDRSLAGSLAWRAAGDWISQVFSWLSLLIVVRLLSPADFGLVAMAVILLPGPRD